MLLTIHNLPSSTRYVDVKSMLQEKCGLTELILDNLISEGNTKQVTVGLADEGDAAILVRKINGVYLNGLQLYVEDKRKKKDSDQPYRSSASLVQDAKYQESMALQKPMGNMSSNMNPMMMNYNMAGMYMPMQMMPIDQNMSYMGYSGFMAMPSAEPRPPAPGNERGFGDYQGEYGGHGGRQHEPARDVPRSYEMSRDVPRPFEMSRDVPRPFEMSRDVPRQFEMPRDVTRPHVPARDTQRPRDRKRRASPERPTEVFNRPSQWNDSGDLPARREPTPPRHPWPAHEPPAERPRNFDEFQPQQEYRHTDPEWQPRDSRWDQDRRPPRAQPDPEPEPRWQPEAEPHWEPEPERPWKPESERMWNEPTRAMENDNQQFDNWKGDYPSGTEDNYPRPGRFEPNDRHFDEGYAPAQHEPEFRDHPRRHRDRRPRHGDDWNAGNDHRDQNIRNNPNRDEQAWNSHEEPHRPSRPSRPVTRDPKPSNFNRKERHEDQRPNPPKRPFPVPQRGPADWKKIANDYPPSKKQIANDYLPSKKQIANDYPPSKKPKVNYEKRPVEPKRNYQAPKPLEVHPKPTLKPKERQPLTQSSISDYKPNSMTRIINKDQTSRGQATAFLYKSILSKITQTKLKKIHPDIVKELRACIRSRIDVMLGEELTDRDEYIVQRYRNKFPVKGDRELYQYMEEKVLKAQKEMETAKGENKVVVKTEKSDKVELKTEDGNKNSKEPEVDKQKAAKEKPKLDRRDMTDKQIISEAKQQRKVEFSKADHYKMDPITDKIAEEELSKISEIFVSECADHTDEIDKAICERITKYSLDEFVQTARLHLAKRILNIRTGLAVRIYAAGKLPRRVFVQEYLKPYRIERLVLKKNKQGTMYVANIGNFEQYDHLCNLQNDVIDGTPVSIRSMYLVGPPPKLSKNMIKARRQQLINSQIAPKDGFLVPADSDELKNNETEKKKEESASSVQAETEDTTLDMNAESMKDFKADDFDEAEFATGDLADDNFAEDPNFDNFAEDPHVDDNFAEDPKVNDDPEGLNIADIKQEDPEGLNIADIKEEDLEDF
ncbi:uncharacterized protein isoform X1 [Choristoneura fumiferana]|uniref:uncharacterized protein isoform X1 n=1 Tax=Choristoneura fumiferana TaxID=7141 RepID=UPI003D1572AE